MPHRQRCENMSTNRIPDGANSSHQYHPDLCTDFVRKSWHTCGKWFVARIRVKYYKINGFVILFFFGFCSYSFILFYPFQNRLRFAFARYTAKQYSWPLVKLLTCTIHVFSISSRLNFLIVTPVLHHNIDIQNRKLLSAYFILKRS